jgi:hypothetical protein
MAEKSVVKVGLTKTLKPRNDEKSIYLHDGWAEGKEEGCVEGKPVGRFVGTAEGSEDG